MVEDNTKWLPGFGPPKRPEPPPTLPNRGDRPATKEEFTKAIDETLRSIEKHKRYLEALPQSLREYVDPTDTRVVIVPSDKEMEIERSNLREMWLKIKKYFFTEGEQGAVIFEFDDGKLYITPRYPDSENEIRLEVHQLKPDCKNAILDIIGAK